MSLRLICDLVFIFSNVRFFVIANATVCGYLAFSLPMAIYHVIKKEAAKSRALLILLDTVKALPPPLLRF